MTRRADIDRAKGFAILLVVFGHLVARGDPAGVTWYEPLRRAVYAFHMPLFLYLSGLVAVISGAALRARGLWRAEARRRAWRLLAPFFAIGLGVVAAKLVASRWLAVDNMPAGFWAGVYGLVWRTGNSPALSVWFLFVLFVVSLAVMVALDGRAERVWWVVAGCLALYVMPLPAVMYADRVGLYAVFFAVGVAAGLAGARWDGFVDRSWPVWMAVLAAGLVAVGWFGLRWEQKLILLPVGVVSMPAIHGWLRFMREDRSQALLFLGRYSFMIYLFNTMFIGLAKGLMLLAWSWNGANFLAFAVVMMASGVLGPVALKRAVFSRFKVLDRLTD